MSDDKTLLERWHDESEEYRKAYAREGLILDVTEQIWEALNRKGWNQAKLAEALGVTASYVSQLLNGSRNMTLRTLSDIVYALGHEICLRIHEKDRRIEWHEEPQAVLLKQNLLPRLGLAGRIDPANQKNWSNPQELAA